MFGTFGKVETIGGDGRRRQPQRMAGLCIAVGAALLCTLANLLAAGAVPPVAGAVPARLVTPAATPAARLTQKVTLPETSIDGPALWSDSFESVIAWTGTDPAHHLNVMTGTDGIHFGAKRILGETSFTRPAVTLAGGRRVVVAWTGTDPNHSLNVLYDVYGPHPKKLTLRNENSFHAPGLSQTAAGPTLDAFRPFLVLAWTGTDANRSLNTLRLDIDAGLRVDVKRTLPAQDSSVSGPTLGLDLSVRGSGGAVPLLLTWAARSPLNRIEALRSHDGVEWQPFFVSSGLAAEWSASGPSILGGLTVPAFESFVGWAWTGVDPAHTLNLLVIEPNDDHTAIVRTQKLTLRGETALGGPSLGFIESANAFRLAWTGTDAAHHLNIAAIAV